MTAAVSAWVAVRLPMDSLSELDDTPVVPEGVIAPINKLLGLSTFGVIILGTIALGVVFGQLIASAFGRGGDGAELLVRRFVKVFIGVFGGSSTLALLTLFTGGF